MLADARFMAGVSAEFIMRAPRVRSSGYGTARLVTLSSGGNRHYLKHTIQRVFGSLMFFSLYETSGPARLFSRCSLGVLDYCFGRSRVGEVRSGKRRHCVWLALVSQTPSMEKHYSEASWSGDTLPPLWTFRPAAAAFSCALRAFWCSLPLPFHP